MGVNCRRFPAPDLNLRSRRDAKAGLKGTLAEPVSPHGLRAGFVTIAYRNGVPDEEIMGHTRHRSLTTMRSYVRRAKLSQASPAGKLGLSDETVRERIGRTETAEGR
jgi:integrase